MSYDALVLSGGGPLAVAWECGVLAGLADQGFLTNAPILGTSAGAILGAQLAAGRAPHELAKAILAEASGRPPPGAMPPTAPAALARLPELFAKATASEAERVNAGVYAAEAKTAEAEAAYVARMQRHIGVDGWPERVLGIVAVDIADGRARVLDRDSGGALAAAVAASCSLPGITPPVTIAGRRYMDGGLRSTANLDRVPWGGSVLVLCFHLAGPSGERVRARAAAQADALRNAGRRVVIVTPDDASLVAIGTAPMDVVRRPPVLEAGRAQGAASAARLADEG